MTEPVILPFDEVKRRCGLSRSSLFELVRQGHFPRPVRLTSRRVGYVEAEVSGWLNERIAASRADAETHEEA